MYCKGVLIGCALVSSMGVIKDVHGMLPLYNKAGLASLKNIPFFHKNFSETSLWMGKKKSFFGREKEEEQG
jgi:hypothetical protein